MSMSCNTFAKFMGILFTSGPLGLAWAQSFFVWPGHNAQGPAAES